LAFLWKLIISFLRPQEGAPSLRTSVCVAARAMAISGSKPMHEIHTPDARVRLFHPRRQHWERQFVWNQTGTRILGTTATGRATVAALRMNNELIVPLRELWTLLHLHPQDKQ